jgi:hypothetical protein
MQTTVQAAVEAGQPPDVLFGGGNTVYSLGRWAYEGRLIDLSDEILPFASLFDRDELASAILSDANTGRRGLYELPMGIATNHLHVWRNLLEQAGFTLVGRMARRPAALYHIQLQCGSALPSGRARSSGQGVRALIVGEGWLMHYLDFSRESWLDPSDPPAHATMSIR